MRREHAPDGGSDGERTRVRRQFAADEIRPGLVLGAVLGVLVVLSLAHPVTATPAESPLAVNDTQNDSSVSPEEALEGRKRAQAFLAELERLDRDPLVSVERNTIESIRSRIETGNHSYDRANYEAARNHWRIASDQARAALVGNYDEGTSRYLNATSGYLSEREEAGYASTELTTFEEDVRQLRAEEAGDLATHREHFAEARRLNRRVEASLPSMAVVRLADLLSPLPVAVAIGGVVVLTVGGAAAYGGFALARRRTPVEPAGEDGPDEEDVTVSTFNDD